MRIDDPNNPDVKEFQRNLTFFMRDEYESLIEKGYEKTDVKRFFSSVFMSASVSLMHENPVAILQSRDEFMKQAERVYEMFQNHATGQPNDPH